MDNGGLISLYEKAKELAELLIELRDCLEPLIEVIKDDRCN